MVLSATSFFAIPVALASAVLNQGPPSTSPSATSPAAAPPYVAPRLAVFLPHTITDHDLDRYARYLGLAESQRQYLKLQLQQFRNDWKKSIQPESDSLDDLAEQGASLKDSTPEKLRMYEQLGEQRRRVDTKMHAQDEQFFHAMEMVLAEAQVPGMERVRLDRQRQNAPMDTATYPAASIDLSQSLAIGKLGLDEADLRQIDVILREYETTVTPIMVRLNDFYRRRGLALTRINVEHQFNEAGALLETGTPAAEARMLDRKAKRVEYLSKGAALEEQVGHINEQYIARILESLPVEKRMAIDQWFKSTAFPVIYPDRNDPARLVKSLMESTDLPEELRADIERNWIDTRTRIDHVCQQMNDRVRRWKKQFLETLSISPAAMKEYRDDMRRLWLERYAENSKFLNATHDALLALEKPRVNDSKMIDGFIADLQPDPAGGASYPPP